MSLDGWNITAERETLAAREIIRYWPRLRATNPADRMLYAIGVLICDQYGHVPPETLIAAIADDAVSCRALSILATIRYQLGDGGEWQP